MNMLISTLTTSRKNGYTVSERLSYVSARVLEQGSLISNVMIHYSFTSF